MSWLSELLREADWGNYEKERQALQAWEHFSLLERSYSQPETQSVVHQPSSWGGAHRARAAARRDAGHMAQLRTTRCGFAA